MSRVSILIPTKDRKGLVAKAVNSVLTQKGVDFEVIVKDGGTNPIADQLPLDNPRLRYLHGPDESITQAVNQAAAVATGDVLHFACDDDEMCQGTLYSAMEALDRGAEWTYAAIRVVRKDGPTQYTVVSNHGPVAWDPRTHARGNIVPQPSTFFTRKAWDLCGPFDESLPLCADYEMWGRIGSRWWPTVRDHFDSTYLQHPDSISIHSQELQLQEVRTVQARWAKWGFGRREGE